MKIFGGLVVVILLIWGAYCLGKNTNSIGQLTAEKRVSPTPTVSISGPNPTKITTVTNTPVVAKLLSTKGWVSAENKVISLKYPAEIFSPTVADNYIQLRWKGNTGNLMNNSPDFLMADNYTGGSRREWYINYFNYYSNEVVFTERVLGKVNVLEARPKNGKTVSDLLIANGNTLVDVRLQGTDLNLVETIVSTMVFKW